MINYLNKCWLEYVMNKVWYYLLGLILMIVSFFYDRKIVDFVAGKNEFMTYFFSFFTHFGDYFIALIIIGMIYLKVNKKTVYYSCLSLIISFVAAQLLKIIFLRERPFDFGTSYSFPSAHATVFFSIVPFLVKSFNKYKYWIFLVGILVVFSRVYLGYHYLSDVIGGALIGYFIGDIIIKNES